MGFATHISLCCSSWECLFVWIVPFSWFARRSCLELLSWFVDSELLEAFLKKVSLEFLNWDAQYALAKIWLMAPEPSGKFGAIWKKRKKERLEMMNLVISLTIVVNFSLGENWLSREYRAFLLNFELKLDFPATLAPLSDIWIVCRNFWRQSFYRSWNQNERNKTTAHYKECDGIKEANREGIHNAEFRSTSIRNFYPENNH